MLAWAWQKIESVQTWARRKIALFERGERIGLVILAVVALGFLWASSRWGMDSQTAVWVLLWFAGLGLVLRRFWVNLFGPVFSFDLVRTTRRSPIFSLRCLYAGVLLVILYLLYVAWFGTVSMPWDPPRETRMAVKEQARFAYSFFNTFLAVQVAAVFLITPLVVSSAIAEEKEKKTLSFLLATDLHDHEIVLGKLASRLTHLLLFLLTGLPVLTLLQFMGGIDPNLVLAWFLADVMTMLGLASISILCSVHAAKPLSAIIYSYLAAGGYLLTTCVCGAPFAAFLSAMSGPLFYVDELEQHVPLVLAVTSVVVNGIILFVCCKSAVANLRRRYRLNPPTNREMVFNEEVVLAVLSEKMQQRRPKETVREERELSERQRRVHFVPKPHPPVSDDPLLWKEQYIDQGLGLPESLRALGQIPLVVGIAMLAYLILVCGLQGLIGQGKGDNTSPEFMNGVVQTLGTTILMVMLLGVALRAAHGITSERDRRTLDGLLTAPVENGEILRAKWVASFLYVRKGWWFLALLWFLGLFTLGLHILAIPLLVFAWCMYALFAAGLGLFLSLLLPNTMRATLASLLLLVVSMAAPLALWTIVEAVLRLSGLDYRYPWLFQFEAGMFVPVVALVKLTFAGNYQQPGLPLSPFELALTLGGSYLYGLLGLAFWRGTCARFGEKTGRMPYGVQPTVPPSIAAAKQR